MSKLHVEIAGLVYDGQPMLQVMFGDGGHITSVQLTPDSALALAESLAAGVVKLALVAEADNDEDQPVVPKEDVGGD